MESNKKYTAESILNSDPKAVSLQLVPQESESQAGGNKTADDGGAGFHILPQTENPDEIDAKTERDWYKECEEFDEWINERDGLDIYQVAAVLFEIWRTPKESESTNDPNNEPVDYHSVFKRHHVGKHTLKALFKVFACGALQVGGMIYLFVHFMFEQEGEEGENVDYCRMNKVSVLKLLSVFFAMWISLVVADQMVNVSQSGLYKFGTLQPPFVNNYIIYFGLFANSFVSIACWVTSISLLYFSDNVTDLILNGLAIYFMKTIDDEMVFRHDYKLIQVVFADYMTEFGHLYPEKDDAVDQEKDAAARTHKRHRSGSTIYVTKYIVDIENTDEDEREGCVKADCCGGPCIDNPGKVWLYLLIFIIAAPVYLLICY